MSDRRLLLEEIAYGTDPKVTPRDRLEALEQLREFDAISTTTEEITPEEALREVESLAAALPGWLVCARVAAGQDPDIQPPTERADVLEVVHLQQRVIAELERRLQQRELALQSWTTQRRLLGP